MAVSNARVISGHHSKVVSVESGIVSTRSAASSQALDVLADRVVGCNVCLTPLFYLCECTADLDCGGLILPDGPKQNFLFTVIGIEVPCAVLGDHGNGERPVFRADIQYRASVGLSDQTVHLLILLGELLAFELVLDFVARRSDFLPCSEYGFQSRLILFLCSLKESVSGFPRGRERPWP